MTSVRARPNSRRKHLLALSAVMAALAVAAPISGAEAAIVPGGVVQGGQANGASGCVESNAPSGIGDAGATVNQICGVPVVVVAPSTGQLTTVTGPMIAGSTVVAPITVSPGPVVVSSLP
jgi:hypothetical protein